MKKNVLKSLVLFFIASGLSSTAFAVERNSSFNGIVPEIETGKSYYMFNLGASMYFGIDYEWSARAAVITNPYQQVQLFTAQDDAYFTMRSMGGYVKENNNMFIFRDTESGWADQNNAELPEDFKDAYWSITEQASGTHIYKIKNRTGEYFGPINSTDNRRVETNLIADNENSNWVFLPVTGIDLELFHAKEVFLFNKINEVESIDGFSSDLINTATLVYQNSEATLTKVKSAIADLTAAQYDFKSISESSPIDCTWLIENSVINKTADDNVIPPLGWERSTHSEGVNNNFAPNGTGNTVLEAWGYDFFEGSQFDYYQLIQGVPNGIYKLSALCMIDDNQEGGNRIPNGNIILYGETGDDVFSTGITNLGTETYATEITVANNILKIGVKKIGEINSRSFTADNFTLSYLGTGTTVGIINQSNDNDFSVVAIDGGIKVKCENPTFINVFAVTGQLIKQINITGESVVSLPAGLYIVNGKKVFVLK